MKKILFVLANIFSILILTSCNALKIQACPEFYAMDTIINITFYNTKDYSNHYNNIKSIYNLYDEIADDFEIAEGNVAELNAKRAITASNELIGLIEAAIEMKEKTNGYYNPFIGRLSHLWKDAIKNGAVIEDDIVNNELEIMNSTSITIVDNRVSLIGNGNLDLGGIAKGYASQRVYEYLKSQNVTGYLINAGLSSILFGDKNKDVIKIGLEEPYDNKFIKIVKAKDKAIGTSSGKYQNAIINNERYHHLLNPYTGKPSNIYDNVNVMCNDSMLCDVYATALFSMELDDAKEFANLNNIDVILFKNHKILYETDGWNAYA